MAKLLGPLPLTDEELETVKDLAATNYSPEKIALYLDVDKSLFLEHYYRKESPVRQAYDGGQLQAEFLVNQKQLELAKGGNITAAQIFLKESEKNKARNILNQVLFGHDDK